ncbi:MAG: methylated-DNA--[protein]-cysteine S-methyltransferase [Bryobacterales bacterium]|nr:methylated-DNA--[protein]-cysteine S-methyltransferase [Bryobacterales bacterium]
MAPLDADLCWQAVVGRDAGQDGAFLYGVLTTGVFCRPSCGARTPKRENVRFYRTAGEAERDGLRACLRCKPLETAGMRARMLALVRYIEQNAGESLTLVHLGRQAGMSPAHLQRTFKAVVGVSPKQYLDNCRLRGFKASLREGEGDVTGAIFDAGFGSLSRLYEKVDTQLGMTPMEYRAGGRGLEITYAVSRTALGLLLLGATDRGLCFLQFGDEESELVEKLRAEYPGAALRAMPEPPPESFSAWMAALNRHLEGQAPDLRLPVHVRGTAFQMKVWRYLQSIPAGAVESYQEVAQGIGQPTAARAVARACASNVVALAIPCHRVIRGSGELGGYRWGLDRKRVLLDQERTQAAASAIT